MEKIDYFSTVPDPRVKGCCKHKLSDILIIAIATYLCGGDDYASMYEFCKHRGESQYESWKSLSSLVQVERLVTFSDGRHSISTISKNSSKFDAVALMQRGAKGLRPNDEGALQS